MDDFRKLIKQVEAVDKKAASILKGFLKRTQAYKDKIGLLDDHRLGMAFVWHKTKQRYNYWAAITHKVVRSLGY